MKMVLIPAAPTAYPWRRRYDAAGFDAAWAEAQRADIVPPGAARTDAAGYTVVTGTSPACVQTAAALFTADVPPESTPLLDELPLRSFRDTAKTLPLWCWRLAAAAQRRAGAARQPESRREAGARARRLIQYAESLGGSCVLIVPPLFFRVLTGELERAGYCLEGLGPLGGAAPLSRVRAMKQDAHCGGCIHNCRLENPGCGIGLTKAKEQGLNPRRSV